MRAMSQAHVLVVDDEPAIGAFLAEAVTSTAGYPTVVVTDGASALDRIRSAEFALVVTDIGMPGIDGIELLRRVKAFSPEVEVILVATSADVDRAKEMIRLGASDYLTKPLQLSEVRASIQRAIDRYKTSKVRWMHQQDLRAQVERQARQIKEQLVTAQERCADLRRTVETLRSTYDATIEALMFALDSRDRESLGHSQRVAVFSEEIAKTLGVTGAELEAIRHGAMLHDIGNIIVPEAILTKAGRLTEEEWTCVRRHADQGHRILQSIPYLQHAARIVHQHHERFDGNGYPCGLRGDAIVLGARIFAVADTLDAMTSDRPYRGVSTYQDVCAELARCAGAQFDPLVVEAFMRIPEATWTQLRRAVELVTRQWKTAAGF